MENASKALVMAGGVLIAIMIISALVLMFNQMSELEQNDEVLKKNTQLAAFNQSFAQYADEKTIKGTDIITLVNKVVDFNIREAETVYIDRDKKITLNIDLTGFAQLKGFVAGSSKLFGRKTSIAIQYDDNSNELWNAIKQFSALEKKYTLASMTKLKSNYFEIKEGRKSIQDATGKDIDIEIRDIEKYVEYTDFKSSVFESIGVPEYEDGQIKTLSFKFIK